MNASPRSAQSMPKIVFASFVGALLEWYDFFIFGTASAIVFAPLFFPTTNPSTGVLASFATFGVGFIARPLGGIVFGHIGDRHGRKASLVMTLLIIGIGTCLIGVLPTYEQAGIVAPILLVLLRLVQGFGLGGEYGGAALLAIEHAPKDRKGFWGSIPQAAASGGILLATAVFGLMSQLPKAQFLSWGWRIPFLISIVMLVVGMVIRLRIEETPDFLAGRKQHDRRTVNGRLATSGTVSRATSGPVPKERPPLLALLRDHPRDLLCSLGARLAETTSSNVINAFGIAYLSNQLAVAKTVPLQGMLIASVIGLFACPLFGALSDRIGRARMYVAGAVLMALFTVPFFMMLNTRETMPIIVALVIAYNLGPTLMFSVQSTFFSELFGPSVRYTGLSIAYQVSAIIGGFTPLIATYLMDRDGGQPWYTAAFLIGVCSVSALSTLLVKGGRTREQLGRPSTVRM